MSLALFDLDKTLLRVNSGNLWVRSEWREGNLTLSEVLWAAWWLVKYRFGHHEGLDEVFRVAARSLEGQREEELDARVRAWFASEVEAELRPGAPAVLQQHRDAGDRIVLATSGTLYSARAAAAAYGLPEVVCTTFEVVDGAFTGQIETLAVGDGKLHAVQAWAEREGESLDDATFYTDSMTDLALLERVGQPVVVHPDRRLRRHAITKGWPIVDWGR